MSEIEPYCWLSCDDAYEMPAEIQDLVADIPEQGALRVWTHYAGDSFASTLAHIGPVFSDPEYGTLTLAERKLIATVVSAINGCVTCLVIHGHNFGELIGDHPRARRIGINYRSVPLSPRERAMADYATKLTESPGKSDPVDLEPLRTAGLSDNDIYHLVETISLWNWSNRMTIGLGLRPDDDFMNTVSPAS
jgi:uncharacterized peroxidase-related enzyme